MTLFYAIALGLWQGFGLFVAIRWLWRLGYSIVAAARGDGANRSTATMQTVRQDGAA